MNVLPSGALFDLRAVYISTSDALVLVGYIVYWDGTISFVDFLVILGGK